MKSPVYSIQRTISKDSLIKTLLLGIFLIFSVNSVLKAQDFWEEVIIPDSVMPGSVSFNSESHIYLSTSNGLYKSTDGGQTWNFLLSYLSALSTIVKESDEVLVGIDIWGHLFYSSDDGISWDTVNAEISGVSLKMINDSILFCLDWGVIYKSSDGGYNWDTVLSTASSEIFNDIIDNQGVLFSGSIAFLHPNGGGICHSMDEGNSWQQISLPGYGVSSFALDKDSNLLCGVNFQYDYLAFGVFRSLDNGYTWDNILSGHLVTSMAVDANGGIYAGCDSDFGPEGVMYSGDNGFSWEPINSGLPDDATITTLSVSPSGYIYATTYVPSMLFRSSNPVVTLHENENSDSLVRLFPNPCLDIINIGIGSHSSHGKNQDYLIEIINSLGEIVLLEKMNSYEKTVISCDISTLAKGFYFVRIRSDMKMHVGRFIKY